MNQSKMKVENEPIYRDSQNGALIFTNKAEIQEYEAKKRKREEKDNSLKTEINTIKQNMEELRNMVELILTKIKEG